MVTTGPTFLCYAREDLGFVLQLAEKLKERGFPIWLDQWDISAGSDWDATIDRALHDCERMIVVLSPAAIESREVRGELQDRTECGEVDRPGCAPEL